MKAMGMHAFAWFVYLFEPEDSSLPATQPLTVGWKPPSRDRFATWLNQAKWLVWASAAIITALLIARL